MGLHKVFNYFFVEKYGVINSNCLKYTNQEYF